MAPADRIHKHFAITADPFPTTADLISSRKAPSTPFGRAWFTFKSFVVTFLTLLVDLLAWVYDKVILLSFPTLYDERCLGLLYSHRMIFDREGDDDINPSWFYQPKGPGRFFHAGWRALMGSFAREWFLMAVASALVFTITVAFLRQYFDIIIADPILHSLSLLSLLSSINALWCDTVFFFFANEAQHYSLRDAYHWTTGIVSICDSLFFNIRLVPTAPAASTMWSFSLTLFFFFAYTARLFFPDTSAVPAAAAVEMSYYRLPPVAAAVVGTFAILFALHTLTNTIYFVTFGAIGMRAYKAWGIGTDNRHHADPSSALTTAETSIVAN